MTDLPVVPAVESVTTAPAAQARLSALTSNAEWAQRLMSGDLDTNKEFVRLTEMVANADQTTEALDGKSSAPEMFETTTEGRLSSRDLSKGVQWLRDANLDDATIGQLLKGDAVSRAEHEAVKRLQAQRFGDQEWTKRLLAGDHEAKRELTLMNVVLAAGVAS